MFVGHYWAIDTFSTIKRLLEPVFRLSNPILVGPDELVQLDDLLLLIVHLHFVVELAKHLLLSVEARHLFSQRGAEHFINHFGHRLNLI